VENFVLLAILHLVLVPPALTPWGVQHLARWFPPVTSVQHKLKSVPVPWAISVIQGAQAARCALLGFHVVVLLQLIKFHVLMVITVYRVKKIALVVPLVFLVKSNQAPLFHAVLASIHYLVQNTALSALLDSLAHSLALHLSFAPQDFILLETLPFALCVPLVIFVHQMLPACPYRALLGCTPHLEPLLVLLVQLGHHVRALLLHLSPAQLEPSVLATKQAAPLVHPVTCVHRSVRLLGHLALSIRIHLVIRHLVHPVLQEPSADLPMSHLALVVPIV
jgi:hypothetical protein